MIVQVREHIKIRFYGAGGLLWTKMFFVPDSLKTVVILWVCTERCSLHYRYIM